MYRAYHAAQYRAGSLDVLCIRDDRRGSPATGDPPALERLVSTLGGTLLVRSGRDLVQVTAEVATERGATYLVIGRPHRRTPLGVLAHRKLPLQLMRALPDVDLQIVAVAGVHGVERVRGATS